ncbi:MAG: hypothetical protein ABIN67_12030 [Ferruginibacter sp.]
MKKFKILFLLAGTLVMVVVMSWQGASLKTSLTPLGILNLEFACNATKANAVVDVWASMSSVDNIAAAKLNTTLDFIFLFFYALLLFYLCKELAVSAFGSLRKVGRFLAKAALAAGLFDILENTGMLFTLNGRITDAITLLTFIFSVAKWALVLACLLYIVITGPFTLYKKYKAAS